MKQLSFSDGLTFFITLREYQPLCAGIFFVFLKESMGQIIFRSLKNRLQ